MDFQYYNDPLPHIIIDNFYTPEELKDVWLELDFLTHPSKLLTPDLSGSAFVMDDQGNKVFKKKNKALFLDALYTYRDISNILRHNQKTWEDKFTQKCADANYLFNYLRTCNSDTTLVSYYEEGDNYAAHSDVGAITKLIWLYKEPKQFQGGELSFADFNHTIELKNNRMLMFPACVHHAVSAIKMNEGYTPFGGNGRYVITNFASFKS